MFMTGDEHCINADGNCILTETLNKRNIKVQEKYK